MMTMNNLKRATTKNPRAIFFLIILLIITFIPSLSSHVAAITEADVSGANQAVQSALILTYSAQKSGGNVTVLIQQLNDAIQLIQKAEAENSTNPAQAVADIQSAIVESQNVASESAPISLAGHDAQNSIEIRSISIASLIVV